MTDYAEPLLKIKAAIKELETLLPQAEWKKALAAADQIEREASGLWNILDWKRMEKEEEIA